MLLHQLVLALLALFLSSATTAEGLPQRPVDSLEDLQKKGFQLGAPLRADATLTVQLALKKANMQRLEKDLLEISDPKGPRYGQHLSYEEVTKIVATPAETVSAVLLALKTYGVFHAQLVSHGTWIEAEMTVKQAEHIFQTTLYSVEELGTKELQAPFAFGGLTLPRGLAEHVTFLTGLPSVARQPRGRSMTASKKGDFKLVRNEGPSAPATGSTNVQALKTIYKVPLDYNATSGKATQCVGEFVGSFFNPDDTEQFFELYSPINVGRTSLIEVIGKNNPNFATAEPSLDMEYIMAMGSNVSTIFYYEDTIPNFAEELVAFFTNLNKLANPPLVVSVSFGTDGDEPYSVADALTQEIIELQTKGVTTMFASGDNGVGCERGVNEPDFPNSPYILMVGATDLPSGSDTEISAALSSGGFSDTWAIPSYQAADVAAYLSSSTNLPPAQQYNASGRGFPDVAAVGVNLPYVVRGKVSYAGGTSFSSPIVGGIISILNDIRLAAGKSSLGFVNPLLYQIAVDTPTAFNDITSGPRNADPPCDGFAPAKGWDPVTGLGSLNFEVLASIINNY